MTTFKRDFDFNDDYLNVVAKNIRKFRREQKLTTEQLALDIGISPDYLRRFETQKVKEGLSLKSLYRLSVVLNVKMDQFFEE